MKAAEFDKIMYNIEEQKDLCKTTLSLYFKHDKQIDELSVKSLNHIITMCRVSMSKMDKFVDTDMYHIIGMGNMNAVQTSKFIKASKELMNYRPYVKRFAAMQTINITNGIKDSKYTLSSGVELHKKN